MDFRKRNLVISLIGILLTSLTCIFCVVFIKNIGNILYKLDIEQFGDIFSQLKNSKSIIPPVYLPLLIYFALVYLLFRKGNKYLILKIVLLVVVFIIILVLSILLTVVNGFYFIDIILSLIENLGGLGL